MRVLASMRDDLRLLFAPVGAAQDAATDFESYRRARTLRAARAALMLGLFGLLFFLPTDFWIFAATPRLCREIIWFRLSAVLLGLPVYAALLRASVERSTPVVVGCGLLCATYSFGFLGLVSGPAEVPLVFTAFFVPTMSVMFLLPLRQRILMVSGTSLGAMLAYYGPHPAYLSYRYNGMVWVFLIFGSATSVAFGHMLYLLEHGKFLQRLQIQQHAAKLEELDRLKDSFVSTVSHELRTPLNTIIGLTDLMLHDPPADQRAYVKTVHQSGETLLAIINDILDLAKIKSGKVELEHLPYAPGEVVDAVVGLFAVACGKKRLRLASSVPAGLPTLLGDARRLKQILTNLVGNAVKFTGRGEVNVDVSLSRESQPMLTIAVSDTGAGQFVALMLAVE
jgi:signal transduction histidine kinase